MLRQVAAFSPGHLTGLFYMQDANKDPLLAGSLGAGFSILKGVTTTIEVKKSFDECSVTINDKPNDAPVSHLVRELFFKELGEKPIPIDIRHTIETPEGAGFGTSGGGALSLVLALNHLYGEPFNTIKAAQIAHVAEVRCKTGLGTVMGESFGGFRILTKAGAPGIGATISIPYDKDLYALCIMFGPLSTKSALSDPDIRARIMKAGEKYHSLLCKTPDIPSFLKYSRMFAEETALYSDKVRAALDTFTAKGINASMPMFGEGIFSILHKQELPDVIQVAQEFCAGYPEGSVEVMVSSIAKRGAGIVSED